MPFVSTGKKQSTALQLARLAKSFARRVGPPTPIQGKAWTGPSIGFDTATLLIAPTGSGKTEGAVLPLLAHWLSRQTTDPHHTHGPFALWISPLRALATDLARRLPALLKNLAQDFPELGSFRVSARSSDTPAAIRNRDRKNPPTLWIVTPESLAIWLCQPTFRTHLASTKAVVVDEIHALANSRRGADLSLSLERLQQTCGGRLLRMGLSATCKPQRVAGRFLAGARRPFQILEVPDSAPLEVTIEHLPHVGAGGLGDSLACRLDRELELHQTLLVFTRTRATAERLARRLRLLRPALKDQIGIHHGSLTRDHRRSTEQALTEGKLRMVIASSSLELGIDIGSVGMVVLVHPPGEAVRLLQRVGRSGRGYQAPRRGLILAGNQADLLQAAVTSRAGRMHSLEPIRMAAPAADALCQHLVSEACCAPLDADTFLTMARQSAVYARLSTSQLNRCLEYLKGNLGGEKRLRARLVESASGLVPASGRLRVMLRSWLGTIPPAEFRPVHLIEPDGHRVLGEVDPGYADQLQPGDRFLLEGRPLQVKRVEGSALEVEERPGPAGTPRWGGSQLPLSPMLAKRLHQLNSRATLLLQESDGALQRFFRNQFHLRDHEARLLEEHFELQETVSQIPTPALILAEVIQRDDNTTVCLHTPLPRSANDALARVLAIRLSRQKHGLAFTGGAVADLGLSFQIDPLPEKPAKWIRNLLDPEGAREDFEKGFLESDLVRRRFQELATTGLMLAPQSRSSHPKSGTARPKVGGSNWAGRRLFAQVRRLDRHFPLLVQAMQETQKDFCDFPGALRWMRHGKALPIRVRFLTQPSPFFRHWLERAQAPVASTQNPGSLLQDLASRLRQGAEAAP